MPKKIPGVVQRPKRKRELPAEILEMQREFELKYAVKHKMEAAQPVPDQPPKSNQPAYNQAFISNQSVYDQSPMPISSPNQAPGPMGPVSITPAPMMPEPTMKRSPAPGQPPITPQPMTPPTLPNRSSVLGEVPMPMMMSLPTVQRQPPTTSQPPAARVLIVLEGKLIGQAHLNKPALTVGRMAGNDIEIPNTGVSRLHARILAEQGTWVIEDAGSVNGVVYQGERVKRVTLCNRACVYLAPGVALHYEVASSPL